MDAQISLRYPRARVSPRVDRLVDLIRDDEEFASVRMSASKVMVMALLAGLKVLEERYGLKPAEE